MNRLSDRLQIIADKIDQSETMADIGTDHGFLPIYLREQKVCPQVILTDISQASLEKAAENCSKFLEESGLPPDASDHGLHLRTGDGLAPLRSGEVDTVVMAGMGGRLMCKILSEDLRHTNSFKKYIFQPRNGQGELRKWLLEHGFLIIGEDLTKEGTHIPEIITALSPYGRQQLPNRSGWDSLSDADVFGAPDEICYRIPPWMVDAAGPVELFFQQNLKKEKQILENTMLSSNRDMEREEQLCNRIYYVKGLLKEYKNGKNSK